MQTMDEMVGYNELLTGAAFVPSEAGYIQLAGVDRVDFLQRQTTNDVKALSESRAVLTVLTSATARILDVLWLIGDNETIGIMTAPHRGVTTAAFLRGKIFFMDKVTVTDQSAEVNQYELEGLQLSDALSTLSIKLPTIDEVRRHEIAGSPVTVIGQRGVSGEGARLIIPAADAQNIENALNEAGITRASTAAYEIMRVEAGLPGIHEMTEEFTPLEVRLNHAVSDSKGCYTGQEIIARQVTYDKVTRSLVGLRLSAPVTVGADVMVEGRNIGVVTSAAQSPRFGPIALAVVKRTHHEVGTAASIGEVTGEVVPIPFTQ